MVCFITRMSFDKAFKIATCSVHEWIGQIVEREAYEQN